MKNKQKTTCIVLVAILTLIMIAVSYVAANEFATDLKKGDFIIKVSDNLIMLKANEVKKSILIEEISQRFGGEIELYDDLDDKSISLDIRNESLDKVLRKILNKNYAFVTNKQGTELDKVNLFKKGGEDQTVKNVNSIKEKKSNIYQYPITPKNKEDWKKLKTSQEMIDAVQLPDEVLKNMSTPVLLENFLNYPLFYNHIFYNGVDEFANTFNGLEELLNRKDLGQELYKLYELAETAEFNPQKNKGDDEYSVKFGSTKLFLGEDQEKAETKFSIKLGYIQMMLGTDTVLDQLSSTQRYDLAQKLSKKFIMPHQMGVETKEMSVRESTANDLLINIAIKEKFISMNGDDDFIELDVVTKFLEDMKNWQRP